MRSAGALTSGRCRRPALWSRRHADPTGKGARLHPGGLDRRRSARAGPVRLRKWRTVPPPVLRLNASARPRWDWLVREPASPIPPEGSASWDRPAMRSWSHGPLRCGGLSRHRAISACRSAQPPSASRPPVATVVMTRDRNARPGNEVSKGRVGNGRLNAGAAPPWIGQYPERARDHHWEPVVPRIAGFVIRKPADPRSDRPEAAEAGGFRLASGPEAPGGLPSPALRARRRFRPRACPRRHAPPHPPGTDKARLRCWKSVIGRDGG